MAATAETQEDRNQGRKIHSPESTQLPPSIKPAVNSTHKTAGKSPLLWIFIPLLIITGIVGYIYRDAIISILNKTKTVTNEPEIPKELTGEKSIIYIPKEPELTADQWEALQNTDYEITIIEHGANIPSAFLSEYSKKHFIAAKVNDYSLFGGQLQTYKSFIFVKPEELKDCEKENTLCGTFKETGAVVSETAIQESKLQMEDTLNIIFTVKDKINLYSFIRTCKVTELAICQKIILVESNFLRKSLGINESSPFSVTLLGSEGKIIDPFITPLPELSLEVKQDQVPLFLWKDGTSSPSLIQTGYSISIEDKSNNQIIFKSGKINGTNEGDYFLPKVETKVKDFSMHLKTWYTYGEIIIEEPRQLSADYTFEYKALDLESNISGSIEQMSWIPDWGMPRGIESVKKNPKKWSTISPVWFALNANGSLTPEKSMNNGELLSITKQNNIRLIPTISQFDADILQTVLTQNMESHIQTILKLVRDNNYAGIDLDYESTYLVDKELFKQFIARLSSELHKENKILIFTAAPKWTDEKVNSFLPQTKQVQDWEFLGKHVDELRIMAYDFTGEGSYIAGPISPILWDEMILKYALTKLPPEKIVLGLPLYSHAWLPSKDPDPAGPNNDKVINSGNTGTISYQHAETNELKTLSTYSESLDTWNYEMKAQFKGTKGDYVMYYLNKNAINRRIDLAKKYKIKGVIYWRIGGEDL